MFSSSGTYPDKTFSVSQCLGSRSGRRPTVMNVVVGPVFITKSVYIMTEIRAFSVGKFVHGRTAL